MRTILAAFLVTTLAGCYTTRSIGLDSLEPNTNVVVHTFERGAAENASDEVQSKSGRFLRMEATALVLAVARLPRGTGSAGALRPVAYEELIDRQQIARIQTQSVSYGRTAGLVALIATGTVIVARVLWGGAGGFLPGGGDVDAL